MDGSILHRIWFRLGQNHRPAQLGLYSSEQAGVRPAALFSHKLHLRCDMSKLLLNKIVIVTGSSSGIGKATAIGECGAGNYLGCVC